jgi:hypothetical protein
MNIAVNMVPSSKEHSETRVPLSRPSPGIEYTMGPSVYGIDHFAAIGSASNADAPGTVQYVIAGNAAGLLSSTP